ncbi:signal transduction histidine kinase [Catalinimonas alkaloidigena]|uniref:sensor histidine kinase n=1 Tax=Catalinimonas alkaloidigena TaxID=1075417 RepID=UPI0024051216|nr:HAMP domain-containing sensor histidine kinase [Catalinimonas alkaloidigena]MDF9797117.1 signal transduction histidine kinase [Catalinimonas alkaloidigena]
MPVQHQAHSLRQSLFWRIAIVLFILFLLLGISFILITSFASKRYYEETAQRLNAHVAEEMLLEVNPFVEGEVNDEALGKIMHSMMAVNPSIEVYLLAPQGDILSYVVLDKKVKLKSVDIGPVKNFLNSDGQTYTLGDDPRNPGRSTIFSAAEVREEGNLLGYVYMILASEEYDNVMASLWQSHILRIGAWSFSLVLIAALMISLLVIWWLTRSLRRIQYMIRKFEEGDLSARVEVRQDDELGQLSYSINNMADTIVRNIDELKQVDKLRKELIANVSHDLRTPLSVIQGYVETLNIKKDSLSEEQKQKYMGIILNSSNKLKRLVNDLFELTKLESRQIEPKPETFAMQDLLHDIAMKYQFLAEEKSLKLETKLKNTTALVYADLAMIERVMQNLLDNAFKYTPPNGTIKIHAEQCEEEVCIMINNSGSVIHEEEKELIFNRYFMGKEPRVNGSGLGLAIVRNILEIHHTSIKVKSDQDEGTTFFFSLPLVSGQ